MAADAGIVIIQATTMLLATLQRTADILARSADAYDRASDRVRRRDRNPEPGGGEKSGRAPGLGTKTLHRRQPGNF